MTKNIEKGKKSYTTDKKNEQNHISKALSHIEFKFE